MTKPKKKVEAACKQCGTVFVKVGQHQLYCSKQCQKISKVEYNKEYGKTYIRKNPVKRLLSAARSRAKTRGIPFDICDSDVVIPDACPVFGIPMRNYTGGAHGGKPDSYSLDRIDPSLGYVKGNIQVISHKANSMKSSADFSELVQFARWVLSQEWAK